MNITCFCEFHLIGRIPLDFIQNQRIIPLDFIQNQRIIPLDFIHNLWFIPLDFYKALIIFVFPNNQ